MLVMLVLVHKFPN